MNKKYQNIAGNEEATWYKDAIIYELHIKAFFDSDGDGIGDFPGLIQKLDYLQDLGVTAIWLLPFYPSPLKDDGYDIADYYSIHPSYGTLRDFRKFMKEAKKRGFKVITELVINHTSDQHPWFQRSRTAKKGSAYRDWYVWSDDPNKYKDTRIIFTDTEVSNWTWDNIAQQYYWHRFFSHQPDLNYDNPRVKKEIFRIIDFWLNMGVDGFRLDAVPYLFEREGTNCENLPETHEFLKELRAHVDEKYENIVLLAEANMWPEEAAAYFGEGDECHMNYHFPLMPRLFMALKMEDRYPVSDIFEQTPEIPENCQWAMFLRNHDELTLEMVTDEERDYMYKMYMKDLQARINVGIRHRLAPLLNNNRRKIELMKILLLSMPGTPVLYYGDEIGMGDNHYLGDRNGVRTPMQWSADINAGFSRANPQKLYLPVILDPEYSYESINFEAQQKNPSSLLWWMKRVINMRKQFKVFGRGDIRFIHSNNAKVLAFTRTYKDESILVIVNLSRFSQSAELKIDGFHNYIPEEIFSQNQFPKIRKTPYHFTLSPHAYYWFLLKKEEVDIKGNGNGRKKEISISKLEDLKTPAMVKELESRILPAYLKRSRWFGAKARTIRKIQIEYNIPLNNENQLYYWLIIKVSFSQGLPERYQLPLAFTEKNGRKLQEEHPAAIVTQVRCGDKEGFLYDAVYSSGFRELIFNRMAGRKKQKLNGTHIRFSSVNHLSKEVKTQFPDKIPSRVSGAEQSNTSFYYNNSYFFKLFRKIDFGIHPDQEMIRFLSKTEFKHVPEYLGEISLERGEDELAMGLLQRFELNQGDAWTYFKDVIERFYELVLSQYHDKEVENVPGIPVEPIDFDSLSEDMRKLFGSTVHERAALLGRRSGEMHIALASRRGIEGFEPEAFSLHYQRSLYSSLQANLRQAMDNLDDQIDNIPEDLREDAQNILKMKPRVLSSFKKIYAHKIDAEKIRTHGDYHLGQVLYTGKDFIIIDFEGEPGLTFNSRRIKRSALRDIAGAIRSFHYAAYSVLLQNYRQRQNDKEFLRPWIEVWVYHISGFFLKSYLETTQGYGFIPDDKDDVKLLLEVFLLEKAVYELNYELNNRPDWIVIPIQGMKSLMKGSQKEESYKDVRIRETTE